MYAPEHDRVPDGLPWLISFPRTGSHWLRMVLELYFDRPMLTRHFFEHDSNEMLLCHAHDRELTLAPNGPVIYLHRGPVSTVFSELTYHHGPEATELPDEAVDATADHYRRHLRHWLGDEGSVRPGCVVAYEWLLDRPVEAMAQVIAFFGGVFDADRLERCRTHVTHRAVAERSQYEPRVMDQRADKDLRRELFRYRHAGRILEMFRRDEQLARLLDPRLLELPASEGEASMTRAG